MEKLIFFDVDGTLAIPRENPSPATVDAIRKARANGNKVFISTGRTEEFVPAAVREIGFDGGIYSAGGRVSVGGKEILNRTMPTDMVRKIMDAMAGEDMFFTLEASNGSYKNIVDSEMLKRIDLASGSSELQRMVLQSWSGPNAKTVAEYQGEAVYKVSFFCASEEQFERLARKLEQVGKMVRFDNLAPNFPLIGGEISDWNINKGLALEEICQYFGTGPEECIAFGDSMNDAEILRTAGLGIAMGNSEEQVKRLADRICESCEEDGVAKELARLGII